MMKGFENCQGPFWAWPRIHVIDDQTKGRSEKNLFSNFQNFLLPMERASHDKKIIIKHYEKASAHEKTVSIYNGEDETTTCKTESATLSKTDKSWLEVSDFLFGEDSCDE